MGQLKLSQLRKIISEEIKKSLHEAEEKQLKENGEDSLDAQIDRYLVSYESESKSVKKEGKDFRMFLRRYLSEAEEPKPEDKKLSEDDIDVAVFVDSVMRLIDNYDSLLEVRNTILRRAVNFLVKGYEPEVALAFKDLLQDRFGVEIGKTHTESEDDAQERPIADRAGPALSA